MAAAPVTLRQMASEAQCVYLERRNFLEHVSRLPPGRGRPSDEELRIKRQRLPVLKAVAEYLAACAAGEGA